MVLSPSHLQSLVEEHIGNLSYGTRPPELYSPIEYIMGLGGKRLRPVLTLLSYSLYGGNPKKILNQAVAVELFHNFTLVHDDIMDQAPLRRGKQTVHEKWNANVAILSGDTMLVKVYDLLLETLEPSLTPQVIKAFNRAAVLVCEGQQLDMNFETRENVEEGEYLEMIRLKTAELLAFSLALGAILAGKEDQVSLFEEFGNQIGIGFQLMDDLLDAYGGEGFGKQVGGDILARKKTILTIRLMQQANKKDLQRVKTLYGSKPDKNGEDRVKEVIELYEKYEIRNQVEELMHFHFQKGFLALKKIDAPLNRKSVLRAFAEALMGRKT